PTAAANNITLTTELLGAMPTLHVDPQRLRQVLNNLLSNALRHTKAGDQIVVSVEQQQPHLLVRVRDSGQGIAPDKLPYVFDRFYRGDTARSRGEGGRRGDGIGLGLAIAKAIVEQHEGELTAVSAGLNHGSTFTISLPLR
ncbi:MAG: ATP-binding protein, partial [Anaerolineales bacterium]|nr:ATP-binding protein [Anaerolineales bacterium]